MVKAIRIVFAGGRDPKLSMTRNVSSGDYHSKHQGQFSNDHHSQGSPARSVNLQKSIIGGLMAMSRASSSREGDLTLESGESDTIVSDSTAKAYPEDVHPRTTQLSMQLPASRPWSETAASNDILQATADGDSDSCSAAVHDSRGETFSTQQSTTFTEIVEQSSSAQASVREDEHTNPRLIVAAALSLFVKDDNDAAVPPISPAMLEPFAAADRTLGRSLGSGLFNSRNDEPPEDSQHAAAMDAICMLQVVSEAFRLRQSSLMNVLYILEMAAHYGIPLNKANYRSLLLTALLITIKEYKECAVYTADLCMLFPSLDLSCLSHLEPLLLLAIGFRVSMLSGHAERQRVASRLEKVRTTEEVRRLMLSRSITALWVAFG
eukprot:6180165-Pleurochrysis_carterae.AAC.1